MVASLAPRVIGNFEILETIKQRKGRAVYFARPIEARPGMPARVVLKTLSAQLHRREVVSRFLHEGQLSKRIDSPYVAKVFETGVAGGVLYHASEYIPGWPLAQLLITLSTAGRFLPLPVLLHFADGLLEGLAAIHAAQVVHRDLSPNNVIVGQDGRLHLIDLGIGRSMERVGQTTIGRVLGTPGYMAPEQVAGRAVDPRADLFVAGVLLYEMACLTPYVMRGSLHQMLEASQDPQFVVPSTIREDLGPGFDPLIARALLSDPAQRFQSAAELRQALGRLETTEVDADLVQRVIDQNLRKEPEELRTEQITPPPELLLEQPDPDRIHPDRADSDLLDPDRLDRTLILTPASDVTAPSARSHTATAILPCPPAASVAWRPSRSAVLMRMPWVLLVGLCAAVLARGLAALWLSPS